MVPATLCFHLIHWSQGVNISSSHKLILFRRINIRAVNPIIWYIGNSILFQLIWSGFVNVINFQVVSAFQIFVLFVCVHVGPFDVRNVQLIMLESAFIGHLFFLYVRVQQFRKRVVRESVSRFGHLHCRLPFKNVEFVFIWVHMLLFIL